MAIDPVDLSRPPDGWRLIRTEPGDICLTRPPHVRQAVAAVCWGLTAFIAYAWLRSEGHDPWLRLAPALSAMAFVAAVWTTWAREEWIARRGALRYQLRFGPWQRQRVFRNATLAITHTVSSEDHHSYQLVVREGPESRTIDSWVGGEDPLVVCGRWLAAATGFPFSRAG
jgi:hypothetical protein